MHVLNRRDFLVESMKGAASVVGVFAGRSVFAMPEGWVPPKNPNITFGVVSDTHLRTGRTGKRIDMKHWPDKFLVAAFRHFRALNVDAVVHCGDMADRGQIVEMQAHADVWRKVFPDNRAADGRKVEKLFVMGNHDVDGYNYGTGFRVDQIYRDPEELKKHILATDLAGWWGRIWGEKYEPTWHKEVKGYHFFGKHWGVADADLERLIASKRATCALDVGDKPFFFLTHAPTGKQFNKAIRSYRNGFGLFGHLHMSAANWKVVRMLADATPSVQCPALYPFFNDGKWLGGGDKDISAAPLEGKLQGGAWRQGLVVRVYDDMLAISRHEYSKGGSLGSDWVMPLERQEPHPFSLNALKRKIGIPQFRSDAKLVVEEVLTGLTGLTELSGASPHATNLDNPVNLVKNKPDRFASSHLCIKIPLADGNPKSRVYAYEVKVDGGGASLLKAVYAAGCNLGIGHEPDGGTTTLLIEKSELPRGENLAISVTPLSSLGTRGDSLKAKVTMFGDKLPKK